MYICTYANELLELINGLSDFGEIGFPISPHPDWAKIDLKAGKKALRDDGMGQLDVFRPERGATKHN